MRRALAAVAGFLPASASQTPAGLRPRATPRGCTHSALTAASRSLDCTCRGLHRTAIPSGPLRPARGLPSCRVPPPCPCVHPLAAPLRSTAWGSLSRWWVGGRCSPRVARPQEQGPCHVLASVPAATYGINEAIVPPAGNLSVTLTFVFPVPPSNHCSRSGFHRQAFPRVGAARADTLTIRDSHGDDLVDAGPFPSRRPLAPSSRFPRGLASLRTREASLWTRSLPSVGSGVCPSSLFLLGTRPQIGRGDTWGRLRGAAGGRGARSPSSSSQLRGRWRSLCLGIPERRARPTASSRGPTLHTLALAPFTPENSVLPPAKASGFSLCFGCWVEFPRTSVPCRICHPPPEVPSLGIVRFSSALKRSARNTPRICCGFP